MGQDYREVSEIMPHHIDTMPYTHFDETTVIVDLRRAWLISKESNGPLAPTTLKCLTDLLREWLKVHGLPHEETHAKMWCDLYAKQVMAQMLDTTAKIGAMDPDIMGTLGTDGVAERIPTNTGTCRDCGTPVFWARRVRHDKTSGGLAMFDPEPSPVGDFHITLREHGRENEHLAAHKWGIANEGQEPRYTCHFDTCPNRGARA